MTTITETMANDHRHCDELFAQAEELIAQGDWAKGREIFEAFRDTTENHFSMEENILFQGSNNAPARRPGRPR